MSISGSLSNFPVEQLSSIFKLRIGSTSISEVSPSLHDKKKSLSRELPFCSAENLQSSQFRWIQYQQRHCHFCLENWRTNHWYQVLTVQYLDTNN